MLREDYALIGDLQRAALLGRDRGIDWLCLPRFDDPAWFSALGFLSRYSTAVTDDGLPGDGGQFLACSFWLVTALARNGRAISTADVPATPLPA